MAVLCSTGMGHCSWVSSAYCRPLQPSNWLALQLLPGRSDAYSGHNKHRTFCATPQCLQGVGSVVTVAQYQQMFLHTNDTACKHPKFYTYQAFITAAAAFPAFGIGKLEVAAFLAQVSHETTGAHTSGLS